MRLNKTWIVVIPYCIVSLGSLAFADSASNAVQGESQIKGEALNEEDRDTGPWRLFGGIASGAGWAYNGGYSSAPGGTHLLLSARLSYLLQHWEIDTGIGWLYSQLKGSSTPGSQINIQTRAGLWDMSARYRI